VPLQPRVDLRIGLILMNRFVLVTVAGLVDSLRFAADASFRGQQILCQWDWMTWRDQPVSASCGMRVSPTKALNQLDGYDYVVVAGGALEVARHPPAGLLNVLRQTHAQKIPIIALCSGSFVLAKTGLLDGRRCAVHFAKQEEFSRRFPRVQAVITESFIDESDIITHPGGSAINLAVHLIRRHCGEIRAQKVLKYMLLDIPAASSEQGNTLIAPHTYQNDIVRKAIAYMRDNMGHGIALKDVAKYAGTNPRQLHREFLRNTHEAPAHYWRRLRLEHARKMLADSSAHVTTIAMECGFSDASHFILWFRKQYGETPATYRKRRHEAERLLPRLTHTDLK